MRKLLKIISIMLTALLIGVSCIGCQTNPDTPDPGNGGNQEEETGLADNIFDMDGELQASILSPADTVNLVCSTDDYGRTIDLIDGMKTDKDRYVGMWYVLWFGQHGGQQSGTYDITKLLNEDPDSLWDTSYNDVSPTGQYHYWGEPYYGYYNSRDPWVIRRHIELFCYAGIDFLVFDATNGFDYLDVVNDILAIMEDMRLQGWNVPKFMFYCNSQSKDVIKLLYEGYQEKAPADATDIKKNGIYKDGRYKELWFCPNDKPLIAAVTEEDNPSAGMVNGNNDLHRVTDPEMLEFFEFKESQWPTNKNYENGWPWIDWTRPQHVYGSGEETVMNVSTGQHNRLPFSDAVLADKVVNGEELMDTMWGRGYTSENGPDHSDSAVRSGANFEEQWKNAIEEDPKYTFVTGWNEWCALKSVGTPGNGDYFTQGNYNRPYFVDTFNEEFSRDVEMVKNGYGDNFYLQLMRNVRNYKGNKISSLPTGTQKTIDIEKGLTQWNSVESVYFDTKNETNRNFINIAGTETYVDNSLINDITQVRVASDSDYIYFLVETAADMQIDLTKKNSMNILIDVEGQDENSFKGFDYVIGRTKDGKGIASVEKYNCSAMGEVAYETSGRAALYTYNGRYMQFRIPKASLGITGEYRINFKIADNVTEPENMESYYTTGDVAPVGRLKYAYSGK